MEHDEQTAVPDPAAAGSGPGSRKPTDGDAPARASRAGRSRGAAPGTVSSRARKPALTKDLRDFASARPQGWGHDDWLRFLESLGQRGHDIRDRDAIGMALEKERLDLALGRVKGLGPQKRKALVERYATLWNLRGADPDDIASAGGLRRDLAERVKDEVS
jgi:hypothetical protein